MKRIFCCVNALLCLVLSQSAIAQTYRIYIDPGHYKGNGASHVREKTGELVREEDVALAVGLKLRNLLKHDTHTGVTWDVLMSRTEADSRTRALNDPKNRAKDANAFGPNGADLFLSIHANKGRGNGTETFWADRISSDGGVAFPPLGFKPKDKDTNDRSQRFAGLVHKHMAEHGVWFSRSHDTESSAGETLDQKYMINRTTKFFEGRTRFPGFGGHIPILLYLQVPGCLNEIGFLDNQENLEKLVSPYWQHRFAEAYRDAVFAYFGLEMPEYLTLSLQQGRNLISWPGIPIGTGDVLINSEKFPPTRILRQWNPEKKEYEQVASVSFGEGYALTVPELAEGGEVVDISFFPRTTYTLHLKSGFNMIGSVSGHVSFSDILSVANAGEIRLRSALWTQYGSDFEVVQDKILRPGVGYLVYAFKPIEITVSASLAAPSVSLPMETQLLANFPNPCNPDTWIPFHLQDAGAVTLSIYGVSGVLVRSVPLGHLRAGSYVTKDTAAYWDGRNEHGTLVASGVYFYTLETQGTSFTRKMVVLK